MQVSRSCLGLFVLALAGASGWGQDSTPLNTGWMAAARPTHAVDDKLCGAIDHVASCELPVTIYSWNLKLAQKGNVEAAYEVGLAYLQGYGVRQDLARAEHWFLIGAQTPYDKQWIADQYRAGQYLPRSLEKTDYWYRAAGDHFSLHELAKIYRSGAMGEPDAGKAISLCEDLLKGGDGYARLAEFDLGNMVIDGQYKSGDRRRDLEYAREIAQELIGQEEYKLAWTSRGSGMDLPSTPEVKRAVVRSAAAFNVDLAETSIADEVPGMGSAERYAWVYIAGLNQQGAKTAADGMASAMSPTEQTAATAAVKGLEGTRLTAGAYYRTDDPLLAPDFLKLEQSVAKYGDPEEQLRLAYHEEADIGGDEGFAKAMALYKLVRDERVGSVRLRVGNEYLLGANGFPQDAERAARWYGFAAKAGSAKACERLAEMNAKGC